MCNNLSFTFSVCVVWVQSNLPMNMRKFRLYTGVLIKQIAFIVYETCMCKKTLQNRAKSNKNSYRVHIHSTVANFTFLFWVCTLKNEVIIHKCTAIFQMI